MNKNYLINEYERLFLSNLIENQNIILYVLFKVNKNIKKGQIRTIIKTKELRYIAKQAKKDIDNQYLKDCLEALEHNFFKAKIKDDKNNTYKLFSFVNIEITDECSQITLTFNEELEFILKYLLHNITEDNLKVYFKLNTYPKKQLYYYLNKNKNIGEVVFTFEDVIKKIFAYEIKEANEYNLYILCDNVDTYFENLYTKIEYEKIPKQGLKIKEITFYFTPQQID